MLLNANERGLVSANLGEGAYLSVGAVSVIRLDQFGSASFAINQGTSAFKILQVMARSNYAKLYSLFR